MERNGLELFKQIDDRGRCPLHYQPSLLRYDKSAAFIADKDGNTALHIVASKGDSSSVKMFIDECPQCFEVVDRQGRNALHLAMQNGDKYTMCLILKSGFLCDLLKMKDNNGNTPLHLLHITSNYGTVNYVIKDPRFDKMAFNKDNLNPLDVILKSNFIHSNEKAILKLNMMDSAGIYPGRRVIADTCEESDGEERKEARQNHLVVAALIATVTFAAGFTMPGGYIQEKGPELGFVILSKNVAFRAFVISDALAMAFSSSAVFIHLLLVMDKEKQKVSGLFDMALPLTLLAIVAMVIAFVTGTYAVLAHSPSLAISASVVGCLFFYISFVCLKHVEWLPLPVLRFLAEKHL